ncbi:PssD/Cps14F family polysaccharide biosynthesis glycosyltransferase [Neolewinella maritima]|nr:PssD/Cps14F family polysaccharide biosynthesis glycosyltransferase [Neolewinella maritima]
MKKKVIFICSNGGHLAQIRELAPLFERYDYLLVTEEAENTLPLRDKYRMRYLRGRSEGQSRNLQFYWSLIVNSVRSLKILIGHRPSVIITTGSHTAVPMCYLGKLLGARVVWILSFARINSRAFSADIVHPIADRFIVQWPAAQTLYADSVYLGGGIY